MKYLTNKILRHRNDLDDYNVSANKIHMFIPTDSKRLFDINKKENINNLSIQYYLQNPIEYKLNNKGFRTPDDFNSEDEGNIFLGCSHTFGIGHDLKNLWSYKLNNIIGGKFWNLAIPGTGVATDFRILLGYYKELKIKNIFHYAPMYPRYEFITNGMPQNYIIGNFDSQWINTFGNLMSDCLLSDEQCEMNWLVYTNAIRGLAFEMGINYYLIEGDNGWHGNDDDSLQARDLMHHTTEFQHKIYQDFLKLYDENLYKQYSNTQEPIMNIETYIKSQKNSIL